MERKRKVLFCGEASFLNTGYSTYVREVMTKLHETGKYELAELASYGQRNDPRGMRLPWRYYGVQPNKEYQPLADEKEIKAYESNPINQFGAFIFEEVCLDFKPDIVFDIRDWWQLEFAERSPFRKCYNWVIMPTVDAEPQARQWISTYQSADAVFTYSTWANDLLKKQSGGLIKQWGTAPPAANPEYKPRNKEECRAELGLDKDIKIFGTVMRNQRRKLYPDLFEAFAKFLKGRDYPSNYKLYCHTAYPDLGWDIPELLQQHGLSSSVYFTYKCPVTNKVFASLFNGAVCESPFTGKFNCHMCNVRNGASYEELSKIMNCFDLYIQLANSEGFGMPIVEAASCGVPVMATDYSAMSSVVRELKGQPIKVKAKYKELETGCYRAVPDVDRLTNDLEDFCNTSEETIESIKNNMLNAIQENFQWGLTAKKLEECFDSFDIRPEEETWGLPARIREPKPMPEQLAPETTTKQLAQWLIIEVLGEPERLNTYFESRLVRDLTYQTRTSSVGGMYENESCAAFDGKNNVTQFDLPLAYREMFKMADHRNHWENRRVNK